MAIATRVMTEWGELSIHNRKGYLYAVKTIKGLKRQVYLGKTIPSQERLEEIAEEINLRSDLWIQKHNKQLRAKTVDTNSNVSDAVDQLRKIEQLASARGESDISKQISRVIKSLVGGDC